MNGEPMLLLGPIASNRVPVVFQKDGEVFADSRDVAAFFDKRHDNVLQVIDVMIRQAPDLKDREFTGVAYPIDLNFQGNSKINGLVTRNGRCYHMTRDGFVLLAMGFTGEKALRLKRTYIAAFNANVAELQRMATAPAVNAAEAIDLDDPRALQTLTTRLLQITARDKATIAEQAAKIEEAAPKVEAYDSLIESSKTLCLSDAAKVLGRKPQEFITELSERGFIFRRNGSWVAKQPWIDAGWLVSKVHEFRGTGWRTQTLVTTKGLDKFRKKLGGNDADTVILDDYAPLPERGPAPSIRVVATSGLFGGK